MNKKGARLQGAFFVLRPLSSVETAPMVAPGFNPGHKAKIYLSPPWRGNRYNIWVGNMLPSLISLTINRDIIHHINLNGLSL